MLINANDPIDGTDNDSNGYIDDTYGWNFYDENNIMYADPLYEYRVCQGMFYKRVDPSLCKTLGLCLSNEFGGYRI